MARSSTASVTVSAHVLLRLVDFCERRGHAPETLCRNAGVEYAWLRQKSTRVPLPVVERLCTHAMELIDDEQLGLHLAEDVSNSTYYDLGVLLLMACSTLGEAFDRLFHFARLWGDGERLQRIVLPDGIAIRSVLRGQGGEFVRQSQECALAEIVLGARALSGRPVQARVVRFAHRAPQSLAEHERIFACPLEFDASQSEIEFDESTLATPMRHASEAFKRVFEEQLTQALAQLPRMRETADAVNQLIHRTISHGSATLAHIARQLGLSERSLQRTLQREGTSFAALLDGVRRETAISYLSQNLTLTQVSSLLGYGDVTAFHHAFRRWTGRSPQDFRANQDDCVSTPNC